jgi:hypothetical protein
MDFRHSTALRRASACAAVAIALVMALALGGCASQSERPVDRPTMYYDLGDAWTTTKRQVRFYDCRTGAMVCSGPASYLDVNYQCRCE